jgi:4a-hydroxytetrahydrobiopterin dehydratase
LITKERKWLMSRERLSESDVTARLETLSGWMRRNETIVRRYEFLNFSEALEFVNRVGEIAENFDHHPDITFGWGYAEILFTTHDAGGLTALDFDLAGKVDEIR